MMALNKEDLFGRNAVINPRQDQHGLQREPFTDILDNMTPISITNQQASKLYSNINDESFSFNNRYDNSNRNKPMNYHYQQQKPQQPYYQQNTLISQYSNQCVNQSYISDRDRTNPLLGGSSNDHHQQQPMPRNQSVGHKTAIPDIRDRKMREREERIRREKEEMEKLSQQYPFGKASQGGGGAPFRDKEGNIVSNRRPYSQVREPYAPTLHSSHSISNIQPPINSYQTPSGNFQNLNQSFEVGQLHKNYYQQANIQATNQNNSGVSAKITNLETPDQREQRMKKQMEYQEVLRIQMLEKKAKEDEIKRKRQEEEMKQELKIKEEIERERQLQMQEKLKKEQQQNKFNYEVPQTQVRNKGGLKVHHTPVKESSKLSDIGSSFNNGPGDFQDALFKPESKRRLDMNQFDSSFTRQQQQNVPNSFINNSNFGIFNQMENNFNSELSRLKNDMVVQQQQFETQLSQLRMEAQRNIDYRVKAEQELQRMKLNSQRESQRPQSNGLSSQRENSNLIRRSMAGMNNYEKLFFGGNTNTPQVQGYSGIGMQPIGSQIGNFPSQFTPNQPKVMPNMNAYEGQGLGGNFEGSISLKADSTFVPLLETPPMPSGYQDPSAYLNDFSIEQIAYQNKNIHQAQTKSLSQPLSLRHEQVYDKPPKLNTYEGDIGLRDLENAIDEISEMNLGENYKHTQKVLEEARKDTHTPEYPRTQEYQPSSNFAIPEYNGIQRGDEEFNHLAYQLNQVNNQKAQEMEMENQELRKEYLMRNIPLNPIEEQSNEHTFPSMMSMAEQQKLQQ